jgi:hypothetical protein
MNQQIRDYLSQAEEIHSDKGYTLSTLERQQEFAKNRNYPLSEEEKCPWDNWKASRDIV